MSGRIIILSGPSRCGKNTTLSALLADRRFRFHHITTFTTRPKRSEEEAGVHHYFISETKFKTMMKHGEFLEWARVRGAYFGTPLKSVIQVFERGENILLEIDIQGMKLIKKKLGEAVTSIFLKPSSIEDVKERLMESGFSPEQQKIRLAEARREIAGSCAYDYIVENKPGQLKQAIQAVKAIVRTMTRSSQGFIDKK